MTLTLVQSRDIFLIQYKWPRLPANAAQLHKELLDERLRAREQFTDTLLDCGRVIGDLECTQMICARLEQELQRGAEAWIGVEACLVGVSTFARHLPAAENTVLPQLLQHMSQLPENQFVR